MKRAIVLMAIVISVLSLAKVEAAQTPKLASSPSSEFKGVTWTFDSFNYPMNFWSDIFDQDGPFSTELQSRTNGKIKLKVVPFLHSSDQQMWAVAEGTADMANAGVGYISGDAPLWSIGALPFFANTGAEWLRALNAADPIFKESALSRKLVIVAYGDTTPQYIWSKKPLRKVEDFKNLKLRTSSRIQAQTIEALGGTSVTTGKESMWVVLERGTVDAVISTPVSGWIAGYGRNVPYMAVWPLCSMFQVWVVVNKDKWNTIPKDLQDIVTQVGSEMTAINRWGSDKQTALSLKMLADTPGMTVIYPPAAELEKARQKTAGVADDWIKTAGPQARGLYDKMLKAMGR